MGPNNTPRSSSPQRSEIAFSVCALHGSSRVESAISRCWSFRRAGAPHRRSPWPVPMRRSVRSFSVLPRRAASRVAMRRRIEPVRQHGEIGCAVSGIAGEHEIVHPGSRPHAKSRRHGRHRASRRTSRGAGSRRACSINTGDDSRSRTA